MKMTKRQLRKVILEAFDLQEVYYDSLKPVENYKDADDLIGQRLWAHTNRTHRNQKSARWLRVFQGQLLKQMRIEESKDFKKLSSTHLRKKNISMLPAILMNRLLRPMRFTSRLQKKVNGHSW